MKTFDIRNFKYYNKVIKNEQRMKNRKRKEGHERYTIFNG